MILTNIYADGLQVRIASLRSMFNKTKSCLPNSETHDPLFRITCNGTPVDYVDPLMKRRAPTSGDVISLVSGKAIVATAQLSSAYDMSKTGNYLIQYDMPT
ncbi:unnamed protein product [Rotaria socialis]|uniref:Uncharacterized protein n=1 Tax=Rotaria socialis TaxID=392032 RepID=A0A820EB40_9BILA|nr:unnamed protein product [Rotaria socialis]CAF4243607.1 unnamed protein product [Rotaria socialis]